MKDWYSITEPEKVLSPCLLFYPERILQNIQSMIAIAGSVERLRPHIKTYKCKEIIQLQVDAGITKFKCATFTEAALLADQGVKDILIAYPLVGPNQRIFVEFMHRYPEIKFAALIDNLSQIDHWAQLKPASIDLYIDVNVGMNRTGAYPTEVISIYKAIKNTQQLHFRGLHLYDGHIRDTDIDQRTACVDHGFREISAIIPQLEIFEDRSIELICGGSVTFPIHAKHIERTLSPGTTLLWDHGYQSKFEDIPMVIAAMLMTRVISKPEEGLLCLDLGHKAVGSEMIVAPVFFPQIPDAEIMVHSEEHLVIKTAEHSKFSIGQEIYGIPYHICPTVALHEQVGVINNGVVYEYWEIKARKRAPSYTLTN